MSTIRKLQRGDRLCVASHNKGKVREIGDLIAPYGVEAVSAGDLNLAEPEETETTFIGNALLKARAAAQASGLPALADDSGLVVHALGGLLHNLVLTACPQRILIGGGVADGQPWLFERLRVALVDSLAGYGIADAIAADIEAFVQPPWLGAKAGPMGAIAVGSGALAK